MRSILKNLFTLLLALAISSSAFASSTTIEKKAEVEATNGKVKAKEIQTEEKMEAA